MEEAYHGSDTFFIFQKEAFPESLFAVAPVLKREKAGIRNPTFDYSMQGVDCYLAYFMAEGEGEREVKLNLWLGTSYQVEKILLEGRAQDGFIPVKTFGNFSAGEIDYLDTAPRQGYNEYRAAIRFTNGAELITDISPVYFLTQQPFLVFPNPVNSRDELKIYTRDFQDKKVELRIYNSNGQQVLQHHLRTDRKKVP